jgi:hypothetical protein
LAHGRWSRNERLTDAGMATRRDVDGRAAGGTTTDDVGGFRPRRSGRRLGRDGGARGEAAVARTRWFYVGLAYGFVHTCLHEKEKAKAVEKVGGDRTT